MLPSRGHTCSSGPSVRRWSGNYFVLPEAEEGALSITLQMVKAESEVTFFVFFGLTFFFLFNEDTGGGKVFILAAHK